MVGMAERVSRRGLDLRTRSDLCLVYYSDQLYFEPPKSPVHRLETIVEWDVLETERLLRREIELLKASRGTVTRTTASLVLLINLSVDCM